MTSPLRLSPRSLRRDTTENSRPGAPKVQRHLRPPHQATTLLRAQHVDGRRARAPGLTSPEKRGAPAPGGDARARRCHVGRGWGRSPEHRSDVYPSSAGACPTPRAAARTPAMTVRRVRRCQLRDDVLRGDPAGGRRRHLHAVPDAQRGDRRLAGARGLEQTHARKHPCNVPTGGPTSA